MTIRSGVGLWLVIAALLSALTWSYRRAGRFEQAARDAERYAADVRKLNVILEEQYSAGLLRVARRDTVLVRDSSAVAEADRRSPPPAACLPNLAARDQLVLDLKGQIVDLRHLLVLSDSIGRNWKRSSDSLGTALAARPKPLLRLPFLELGPPKIGPYVGVNLDGRVRVGIGVTIPLHLGG